MKIVIAGTPLDGLYFYGPFPEGPAAVEWAEAGLSDDWWVAELNPTVDPAEARVIYVVTWQPESVGGFEWRTTHAAADKFRRNLIDPTATIHEVTLPSEVGDDPEGITAWLDSEGWSDGEDPR